MIDEKLLDKIEEQEQNPAIARLIELGRQKSFVTINDILALFPDAEQDVDQLEEAFSALLSAGIPYIDDHTLGDPSDEDLIEGFLEAKQVKERPPTQKAGRPPSSEHGGFGSQKGNEGISMRL